jgi:hypothetical protein
MQNVVAKQPEIAHAVRCLSLYDQLDLTLALLQQDDWPEFESRWWIPTVSAVDQPPTRPTTSIQRSARTVR